MEDECYLSLLREESRTGTLAMEGSSAHTHTAKVRSQQHVKEIYMKNM